jgi:DNA adenine methylase
MTKFIVQSVFWKAEIPARAVKEAKPFLKWAGGKGQLLSQIEAKLPPELVEGKIKRYIEPFVGGGAVFFYLAQKYQFNELLISDINPELYLAYLVVKVASLELIDSLRKMQTEYHKLDEVAQKEFYYSVRLAFNAGLHNKQIYRLDGSDAAYVQRVAQLIFLNKTCFNGLYRVNSKGEFNVPFGAYLNPKICDEENLTQVSRLLARTEVKLGDYRQIRELVDEQTFVYFDPPYRPLNKTSNFTAYSAFDFDDKKQVALADFFRELDQKGAKLLLSNSDPKNENPQDDFFEKAYAGFRIERVNATRMINSNAEKRGEIKELLVANY